MSNLYAFSSSDVKFEDDDKGTLLDAYKRQSALLCVQLYSLKLFLHLCNKQKFSGEIKLRCGEQP